MTQFPMGFWLYKDADAVPVEQTADWEELGMTLTLMPRYTAGVSDPDHVRALLDAAQARGIRVIMNDSRCDWARLTEQGENAYIRGLQQAVGEFGDHPAVWAWHVGDEPSREAMEDACLACRLVRRYAPCHRAFINLFPDVEHLHNLGFPSWDMYLDEMVEHGELEFLCYDCYAQMKPEKNGWDTYFRNLREYQQAAHRHGIPFWTTLLTIGHFDYRCPSLDDMRWQLYTAAAHGASGVLWFYVYAIDGVFCNYREAAVNIHGKKTRTYDDLSDTCCTFQNYFARILIGLQLEKVQHLYHAYGGTPLFEGDDVCDARTGWIEAGGADTALILSYFVDKDGRRYVMMTNNSCTDSVKAQIVLHGERRVFWCAYGNREIEKDMLSSDNGPIWRADGCTGVPHWLAPGQAFLIRYE